MIKMKKSVWIGAKELSLETLSNLTRSMEMDDKFSRLPIMRALVNETITPGAERAVMTWITSRPSDEIKAMSKAAPAVRALRKSIQDLQQDNVDPALPRLRRWPLGRTNSRFNTGCTASQRRCSNGMVPRAQKWQEMSERVAWSKQSSEAASMTPEDETMAYIHAVHAASPCARRVTVASGA